MFTGIVRELGTLRRRSLRAGVLHLEIEGPLSAARLGAGDSVAVNGACLTATALRARRFAAQAVPETLARTNLGMLQTGARVNLETSLAAGEPLGGHFVAGHVDGLARVLALRKQPGGGAELRFTVEPALERFLAEKGSVTLEGVSLTVASCRRRNGRREAAVALIPHTLRATTLGRARAGTLLNLEVDLLARYLEELLAARPEIAGRGGTNGAHAGRSRAA